MVVLVALNWWRQDVRKVDFSERSNPDCPARPIAMHSGLNFFLKSDLSFYIFYDFMKREHPLKRVSSNLSCFGGLDDVEIPRS
jgi:hypothetical protein